jgi:hypothetical protein
MTTNELKSPPGDSSTTSVMANVLHDAQELLQQQLRLFRAEVKEDLEETKQAIYPMACGLATLSIGAVMLSLTLVHLLHWTIPALPLWGAYAMVGALLTAGGAGMYFAGKKRLEQVNPLPEKTAEAVKENIQWLTQPK